MAEIELSWNWQGVELPVGVSRLGSGPTVLLLPALSSISTRAEMAPLQQRLASSFDVVAVDWPGFGLAPSPAMQWQPDAYAAFLQHLVADVFVQPFATVAAGHAAGYVLAQAAASPGSMGLLCLVAPTWRGPLPTMLGRRHPALPRLARAGDLPIIGPLLYRLNVNRMTVGMMARGHVYADPAWLTEARLAAKLAVTRIPHARHAALRFVTGELDPMQSRAAFLATAGRVADPILVLAGADTPHKSAAEIAALCALPNVQSIRLPRGKLAIHEEFPDDIAASSARWFGDLSRHAR